MATAGFDDVILENLLELSPFGVAVLDRDLRYVRINARAAAFNGRSVEDHLGRSVREIASSATWAVIEPILRGALERGERFSGGEVPGAVLPGQVLRSSAWPLRDREGAIVGVVITREEITESKRAADALRESEARYRALVELSPLGVAILGDGCITFMNAAAAHMLGGTPSDFLGCTSTDFVRPEYAARARERQRSALDGPDAVPLEETDYRRLDGAWITVQTHGRGITVDGRPATMVVFRGITEQKRVERERELQAAALEAVANGVLITDPAGVVEWVNPAYTAITGFSLDEARGRKIGDLVASDQQSEAFFSDLWRTIRSGRVWHDELVNRRKDGRVYTEEMTITPLTAASGEITHYIAVTQDVTHRRLLEEEFRQAQKMDSIGRLAGGVAHDFNNQLGVIIGQVELELRGVARGSTLHESLTEIHDAATRSAALTRQLLTFARKQDIAPRVIDLNEQVAQSLRMLQRMIGEHVRMSWEPAAEPWPILIDPSQLEQVLANLCVNARDAIADVGRIALSTTPVTIDAAFCEQHVEATRGEFVRLTVRDTGCGMAPEVVARIFEPFFTTKRIGEGTGLGLSTVYGAVRQNHGFICVASTPGAGTTFDVYLPRHAGAVPVNAAPAGLPEAPTGTETVLLVEDEAAILRMTARALEALGYTVLPARSADEAMRAAAAHEGPIALLLTDVVMPEMNGHDLAARLTRARPALKCLFMSGFRGRGAADGAAVPFIAKPFSVTALAVKIREVLGAG